MNTKEYEQKKQECWAAFKKQSECEGGCLMADAFFHAFDRAYDLGKQEKDADDDKILKVSKQLFCRLCADADDYINEHLEEEDSDYGYYKGRSDVLHELFAGEPKDTDTVIQGWVARDDDGDLFFYNDKPRREKAVWDEPQYWIGKTQIDLDPNLSPDLTWDSDPEQVEIIIKRKKNG